LQPAFYNSFPLVNSRPPPLFGNRVLGCFFGLGLELGLDMGKFG